MADVVIASTTGAGPELDSVAPLWKAMVDHHRSLGVPDLPIRDPEEAWRLRRAEYLGWLADGSGLLLLARLGRSTAPGGYAFLRTVPSGPTFDLGAARGEVESLVVGPEARGAGIGTALLERARAELRGRGCAHWTVSVMEANAGAVALYERVGFRPWLRTLAAPLDGPAA